MVQTRTFDGSAGTGAAVTKADPQGEEALNTVVVTGATGFVGGHTLQALADGPWEVIAACRDPARLPPGFSGEVMAGDLRDSAYCRALANRADGLIHAAAWSSLYGHQRRSARLFREPSLSLIEEARRGRVSRFVFVSSTGAARPGQGTDANQAGRVTGFWPHLDNVVTIEEALREAAQDGLDRCVSMRLGLFVGENYGLGLLPILVPRLKTRLVPWVAGGRTPLPLIDGEDIGRALRAALETPLPSGYQGFNAVGPTVPTAREVITFLHEEFDLPKPWFSVPFCVAHPFAAAMEALSRVTPWDPLVSRAIIHLLRDFKVDNDKAKQMLGYDPHMDWRGAIRRQMAEMADRQKQPMRMIKVSRASGPAGPVGHKRSDQAQDPGGLPPTSVLPFSER
ncbi:NAD(P)-dependent oxidoreductase [Magnetospira sp. QH-2]|uniref:NAD-dependent epimerase/dehydratase family protein n=1 Tax=Magnetospira sp. (strain QH-2) TaxID=1288970 RepID=UPI0003E8196C|nr:NAD(P)-dependent oxidoreductase [Magnetospira sp. QH-2]CCQ75681.1 putative NAD-dependent epimerase/dehydratase [Magnetospira sp. QH-2]